MGSSGRGLAFCCFGFRTISEPAELVGHIMRASRV